MKSVTRHPTLIGHGLRTVPRLGHPVTPSPRHPQGCRDPMLEQQTLLLRPWVSPADRPAHPPRAEPGGAGPGARTRTVLAGATGAPLGFAAWRPAPGVFWRRWFFRP